MINIPFTVYAKIIPDRLHNKRRTFTKSLEKIARYVADDIANYLKVNPSTFWINEQQAVSVVPQMAQFPSKLIITGWDRQNITNYQPVTEVLVDAPYTNANDDNYNGVNGKSVQGFMATQYLHPQGQAFNTTVPLNKQLLTMATSLKIALEASSIYLNDIIKIDYMGMALGERSHSI